MTLHEIHANDEVEDALWTLCATGGFTPQDAFVSSMLLMSALMQAEPGSVLVGGVIAEDGERIHIQVLKLPVSGVPVARMLPPRLRLAISLAAALIFAALGAMLAQAIDDGDIINGLAGGLGVAGLLYVYSVLFLGETGLRVGREPRRGGHVPDQEAPKPDPGE